jgi:hypothetical protein
MKLRLLAPLALILCAVGAAAASAAAKPAIWATVTVCDTPASSNKMGVRARMPGSGRRERMYMRFTAQFLNGKKWQTVSGKGVSPWLFAGSGLFKWGEAGYTFYFGQPKAGSSYLMRGFVQFEWRNGKKVTFRRERYTAGGHPMPGAQPKGYSAAVCTIR